MTPTRTLLALLAIQCLALAAIAQSGVPASAEAGRAFGGTVDAIAKGARPLSGSLSMTHSTGALRGQGYEASLGGELLGDRLWFFAAASVLPNLQSSRPAVNAIDAKATAQPVDWTAVTASFNRFRQPLLPATGEANDGSLPSSFLSLRSTSVLSDRMTLGFSFSHATAMRPGSGSTPAGTQ